MANIIIYTTNYCPYCVKVKQLFINKDVPFSEVDLSDDHQGRLDLIAKCNGKKTVPQIFINNLHVGGCDDVYALEAEGKLDLLINA